MLDDKASLKDVEVFYYVANPSTSVYLDEKRPVIPADQKCDNTIIPEFNFEFKISNHSDECPDFNDWKYGLSNPNRCVQARDTDEMVDKFSRKNVTFVAGLEDRCCACDSVGNDNQYCCVCDNSAGTSWGIDDTCGAELMGRCRLQRLHAYFQYLQQFYEYSPDLNYQIIDVPDTEHDWCIIHDERVRESMFGTGVLLVPTILVMMVGLIM